MPTRDARRDLPQIEQVAAALSTGLPHALAVACAREAVDAARRRVEDGGTPARDEVVNDAEQRASALERSLLQGVVNATGVVLHTNLGRAPLADDALRSVDAVARGYSNLEFDLEGGSRGSRHGHAGALLARLVGSEAGIVVNNNAAAVLLVLAALARGRDVLVSRGELVEIGGGFRVPDVMAESGARLVEVGTTNRTRLADYRSAATDDTAALLKVHASNYRMEGFVESTPVADLARLGPPVVFDAGSGLVDAGTPWLEGGRPDWLGDEPGVRQAVEDGASVVTFSGDKLLGGPQAGVIVGRADLVARVASHPLARVVRADKMTLAALQATALTYLSGRAGELPLWKMASSTVTALRERAAAVVDKVGAGRVVATEAVAGGGSVPGTSIPSAGVVVEAAGAEADALAAALRRLGVVGRVTGEGVVLDLRTVDPAHDGALADALSAALASSGP